MGCAGGRWPRWPRKVCSTENDTGPDHANHAEDGVFVLAGAGLRPGPRAGLSLYDVAPTLQSLLGLDRGTVSASTVVG